jgi:hypothetical protein
MKKEHLMFFYNQIKIFIIRCAGVFHLCALVFICANTLQAQPVRFSLPANAAGSTGETVTISLHIDPNDNAVGSFDATVEFKNTLLTYTGFAAGPILAAEDGWLIDVNGNNDAGAVTVGAFSFARLTSPGAAILLKFIVAANAASGDSARLLLTRLAATDTNAASLAIESVAGKFTVTGAQNHPDAEDAATTFAFPSPFNPAAETAQIRFVLKNPATAAIKIFNGRGETVREFSSPAAPRPNVAQSLRWDGRNGRGEMVANGIYFYIIEATGNARMSGKIGVVR